MSPSKSRRRQMKEFEDQLLSFTDDLFKGKQPASPAQQAEQDRQMLTTFAKQAPEVVQEVYRQVASTSGGKTDNQVLADLFHAFHVRAIDDFTPGEHTLPVVRALAASGRPSPPRSDGAVEEN